MQLLIIYMYLCQMKNHNEIIDFENSIAPWLGKTVKLVENYLQEAFNNEGIDLTKEQMIVLKKLHDKDGINQNELAILTLRDKSSLTRLLAIIEKKKFIIKKQCKHDKRINHVYLTALGRDVFKKSRPIIKSIIERMEQNISNQEKQQIITTLKKIQHNFNYKEKNI